MVRDQAAGLAALVVALVLTSASLAALEVPGDIPVVTRLDVP